MYKKIYTTVDNSPYSEACCTAAVSLADAFGAAVVGSHVYAARLHERRFRQMEATLPEEYLDDDELARQRSIHNKLITLGLRLISECYLDSLGQRCREAAIPFSRRVSDGKNWERLVEDITSGDYDLVVLGARGHGSSRPDAVGSVCLRVLRHIRTDALVIKELTGFDDGPDRPVLVALDGSAESFGALRAALHLGRAYARPVEAVAVYDPYFHYAVFHRMVQVLSDEAARVFRFKEQERLHEEIIDTGLARLYQTHLEVARRLADAEGVDLTTTLLAGRAADAVLAHAEKTRPWLLCLGRSGVHGGEDAETGSVTEYLLRLAPGNLLIASQRYVPPLDVWGQSSLRWTEEASALLDRVPTEYRGALRLLVHRLALERGHTVVTASLVDDAREALRPRPDEWQRIEEAARSVATEVLRREPGLVYLCVRCGQAVRGERPAACPVCREPGTRFLTLDPAELEAAAQAQGGLKEMPSFDGQPVRWSGAALAQLRRIEDQQQRERARLRLEKEARLKQVSVITLKLTLSVVPGPAEEASAAEQ